MRGLLSLSRTRGPTRTDSHSVPFCDEVVVKEDDCPPWLVSLVNFKILAQGYISVFADSLMKQAKKVKTTLRWRVEQHIFLAS